MVQCGFTDFLNKGTLETVKRIHWLSDGSAIILVVKTAMNSGETWSTTTMELVCQKKPSGECSDGYHGL